MPRRAKPWYREAEQTWCVWHGGKQVPLAKGPKTDTELAAWAAYHALTVRAGTATPQPLTVFEAATTFLDHSQAVHTPGTYAVYKGQLQPVTDQFGRARIADLKATQLERWIAGRKVKGDAKGRAVSDDTRRNYIEALRTAIRHCRRAGLYDGPDPTEGVKLPKPSRRERTLTPQERTKLLDVASPALRDHLLVVGLTGCRPHVAEILTAADIRWDEGTAHCQSKGKRYTLHLPAIVLGRLRELASLRATGPLLLSPRGLPWNRNNRADAYRRACKAAGIEGVVPYSLRHSYATDALEQGIPVATVATLLNHSDLAMLAKHYAHLAERRTTLKVAAEDAASAAASAPTAGGRAARSSDKPPARRRSNRAG